MEKTHAASSAAAENGKGKKRSMLEGSPGIGLFLFALILLPNAGWLFAPGQSWQEYLTGAVFVLGMATVCGLSAWFNYYYHFNDKTRQ